MEIIISIFQGRKQQEPAQLAATKLLSEYTQVFTLNEVNGTFKSDCWDFENFYQQNGDWKLETRMLSLCCEWEKLPAVSRPKR